MVLMKISATHSISEQIVSDNGTQFTSSDFHSFCRANNIRLAFSATYHPATNGESDRFVQTLKSDI